MSTTLPKARRWPLGCLSLCLLLVAGPWFWISRFPQADVQLSDNRRCTLQWHRWYSGSTVLSCYQNGARTGTTELINGLFEHPWAMFPGPDGNTVVCFSILDMTYATFAVDVTKPNNDPKFTQLHLRVPVEPVLERSDFLVRACTAEEVKLVAEYIKTTDSRTLARSVRGGVSAETREDLLTYLTWSTTPYNSKDPVLKFAKPQILPRN